MNHFGNRETFSRSVLYVADVILAATVTTLSRIHTRLRLLAAIVTMNIDPSRRSIYCRACFNRLRTSREIISVGHTIDLNSLLTTPRARRGRGKSARGKSYTRETDSVRHLRRSPLSPRLVQTNFSRTRPSELSRPRDDLMERGRIQEKRTTVKSEMNQRPVLAALFLR